jgi:hypothetical protein
MISKILSFLIFLAQLVTLLLKRRDRLEGREEQNKENQAEIERRANEADNIRKSDIDNSLLLPPEKRNP